MPALIGPIGTVVNLNQAVNGNALGNPAYASQIDVANQIGGQAAVIANYNASLASANATTLATTILNNMFVTTAAGVSAANVTALTSALSLALSSYPTAKGQVISNLANLLGGLESDASWGPAALAFNSQAAADYVYSTTLANTNAGVPSAVASYTLTTGVDTFVGTSGNDSLFGVSIATGGGANGGTNTTLNIFDTIALGAGIDTLNLNTGGAAIAYGAANTPLLGGVEILNLSNQGGAITFAGALGPNLTTLGISGTSAAAASTTLTATVGTLNTLNLTNITGTTDDVSITYETGALAGTSDAAFINLNGVQIVAGGTNTSGNAVDIALVGPNTGLATGFETVTITASGTGTNRIGTLAATNSTPASTMTALNLVNNATGGLRISNVLDFKTVSGNDNGTITATGTSGVDVLVGTENITMTGGDGNDTIRFAAVGDFTSSDSINLGGGTNTLWVADTTISTTTTVALNALINAVTSAQRVGFSAASTVSMSGITASQVVLAANAYTFTSLAATDFLNASGITTGAMTLTASIGFNTVNLNVIATGDAEGGFGTIAATGQATINIASTASAAQATANTIGAVTNDANTVVVVTGTQDLTITSFSDSVGLTATAFTGILNVTGGNVASSFTGGSGADVITGGTLFGDTIIGGAGNDTLSTGADALAGGATMTGGLGADSIILASTTAVAHTTALNTTAAESFATAGQFDTVTFGNLVGGTNVVTVTSGVLSSTITAATSVVLGTTVVAAGSFLVVNAAGVLTANNASFTLYQDSNSDGIIGATDLQINFTVTATDTFAVATVGGKAVITDTGVA
jgi:hypothetical protein